MFGALKNLVGGKGKRKGRRGPQAHGHHRVHRRRRAAAHGVRPVDAVPGLQHLRQGREEREPRRRHALRLEAEGLLVQPQLEGQHHRTGARRPDLLDVGGRQGHHEGRGLLPRARATTSPGFCWSSSTTPQGLFEKTGNIWRAQGRRARLDLKNFARFIMLRGEAEDGWRGEIRDGEVVRSHEDALAEEEARGSPPGGAEGDESEEADEDEDEARRKRSRTRKRRPRSTKRETRTRKKSRPTKVPPRTSTRRDTRRKSTRTSDEDEDRTTVGGSRR